MINTFHFTAVFDGRPLDRVALDMILLAGRMAPSGHNMQTWRFTVLSNGESARELARIAGRFPGKYLPAAPVMILVSNDRRNPHGIYDASAACVNMMLSAHSMGLGAFRSEIFRDVSGCDEARDFFGRLNIPETHAVWNVVGLGQPSVAVNFAD